MDRKIVRSRKARRRAARKWGARRTIVPSVQGRVLDRFRDSVKLKGKSRSEKAEAISFINDIVIAVLAGILIILMFILQASLVSHLSYRLMIAITYLLPLVLLVCLFLTLITPMDLTVDLSFAAHSLYAFCLTISGIDFVNLFADKLVKLNHQKKESAALLNLLAPCMCFTLMELVEMVALFCCIYDIVHGRVGRSWARWWIRTAAYPLLGIVLLVVFWTVVKDIGVAGIYSSNIYSVLISLLVVGFLPQIIKQRLSFKDDKFKQKQINLLSIR